MEMLTLMGVIVVTIVAISTAIIILINNYHSRAHRWLSALLSAGVLWSTSSNLISVNASEHYNLLVAQVAFVSAILMVYSLFNFTRVLVGVKLKWATIGLAVATFIAILLSMTPLVSSGVIINYSVLTLRGPMYYPVVALIVVLAFTSIGLLIYGYRKSMSVVETARIRIVILGLSLGTISGIITNILLPNIYHSHIPSDFSWVAVLIWTVTLSYAMIRHQFLDIRLAIVRSVSYVASLATLILLYLWFITFVTDILDSAQRTLIENIINMTIIVLLVFVFPAFKKTFDHLTDKIFYRENYQRDEFVARFTKLIASTSNLHPLLHKTAHEIASTMRASQVFFVIYRGENITCVGTESHRRIAFSDARRLDVLVKSQGNEIIIGEDPDQDDEIRNLLMSHRVSIALPLGIGTSHAVGYLMLGEHLGRNYTTRDLRVLETISGELAVAIQNALSVEEIKELNENLRQRINSATLELRHSNAQLRRLDQAKDEFVSMASHQLRTPLTSVKGYLDMVLEGDAGDITPAQRKLLSEAYASSERMVHLISDFLSVSRLQTGKFVIDQRPTDLVKVMKQEIDSLKVSAMQRELSFHVIEPTESVPLLNIDEAKFRQVIMNFADNALYYSPAGSKIDVQMRIIDENVEFTVTDKGIGVPEDEQAHLFTKFFRAQNARKQRPDGTGVGLYLTKRVVDAHGGEVIFRSKEGKGSTFGFRLPIKHLSLSAEDDSN